MSCSTVLRGPCAARPSLQSAVKVCVSHRACTARQSLPSHCSASLELIHTRAALPQVVRPCPRRAVAAAARKQKQKQQGGGGFGGGSKAGPAQAPAAPIADAEQQQQGQEAAGDAAGDAAGGSSAAAAASATGQALPAVGRGRIFAVCLQVSILVTAAGFALRQVAPAISPAVRDGQAEAVEALLDCECTAGDAWGARLCAGMACRP